MAWGNVPPIKCLCVASAVCSVIAGAGQSLQENNGFSLKLRLLCPGVSACSAGRDDVARGGETRHLHNPEENHTSGH